MTLLFLHWKLLTTSNWYSTTYSGYAFFPIVDICPYIPQSLRQKKYLSDGIKYHSLARRFMFCLISEINTIPRCLRITQAELDDLNGTRSDVRRFVFQRVGWHVSPTVLRKVRHGDVSIFPIIFFPFMTPMRFIRIYSEKIFVGTSLRGDRSYTVLSTLYWGYLRMSHNYFSCHRWWKMGR